MSRLSAAPAVVAQRRSAFAVDSLPSAEKALERLLLSVALRRVALVVCLLLIARGMAGVTWRFFAPVTPAVPTVSPLGEKRHTGADVSMVFAAYFFGDHTIPARLAAGYSDATGVGDLGITLIGVMAAGRDSMAILSVSGQPPETYGLGKEISSGVVLDGVFADHITVRHHGRIDTIMLSGAPDAPAGHSMSGGVSAIGPNRFSVSREAIRAELSSPEALLQAQVEPATGGGLALSGVEPGSVYERLGLKSGTVIKSVNGTNLQAPEDLLKLYQQIGSSSEIQIDVVIDGRQERLRYEIQ